jgi:hypothetical protein
MYKYKSNNQVLNNKKAKWGNKRKKREKLKTKY